MRIKLYMDWTIAMSYLEPIYHYIKKNTDWDVHFTARDKDSVEMVKDRGYPLNQGIDNYDWAICCDKLSACPTGNRLVIFHGISSKGQDYCNRIGVTKRNVCPTDVSFVPSEYYRKLYIEKDGASPDKVIVAGITKFDTIKEIPKPNEVPKILYAPTHNPALSSIPVLGESVYELDNLTVHLHYYTRSSDNRIHYPLREKMKEHNPIDDITGLMVNSDIVIADLGSTVLEALALGKFVIQVKNPNHYEFYKGRVGEEAIKDIPEINIPGRFAYQAQNIEQIKEIIKEYPQRKEVDFPIIENIGNYKSSKIIYEFIYSQRLHA